MTRRALILPSALLIAALAPGTAAAASHEKKAQEPVVKSVSPAKVTAGKPLTLRGKNFVPGKGKTRVMVVRVKGRGVATASAVTGSRTKVIVTVPTTLNTFLKGKPARFKLRVLAGKLYGAWTPNKLSPVVSPGSGGSSANPVADCDK